MLAPSSIPELVDKFSRSRDAYVSHEYNETQLRREFLDPFFGALGWDIENKQGHAEAYKDVIHEDAIKIGSATKAPDYSFRVGGIRKFFVEAKKPSVNLREDAAPAYQLRRYAWSAKLPLSVLTDFQEFVVYDCRVKPFPHDKPSTGRTLYLPYTEYETRWAEIADVFSKEAVLKGSFDKYAETNKSKKGTAEVDDAFLQEIETWRKTLAANIALRNPKLTQRELNAAVQRTIDRIIFLRICEDRGIETYGTLMAFQNGVNIYKRLIEVFHRADEKYNSGLFHFREESNRGEAPDELTLSLAIDDKPLKEIIKNLYYPDSPYEFSVLPADILGQVYEQFLGKVIRLTTGHHAVVEDKPEVKKAGGVYYTPTYIVDYIVKNTVGKILSGDAAKPLTPRQVARLRVLDPACGSGSFLIGAYQHLLDWHRDWYVKDGADKWTKGRSPALYQSQEGEWRLTTMERKRILLNNIYGVDIDAQAVETTKLSLLLKVLEGENEQTISRQLKMFQERALPDLGNNIKCGNSLIGPDFYSGDLFSAREPQGHGSRQKDAGDDERMRINAFDWNAEFKDIMDGTGFDAVIGNPPWGATFSEPELDYLKKKNAEIVVRMIDSFMYFVYQTSQLIRASGHFGMIVPDVIMYQTDNLKLRQVLLAKFRLNRILNMGDVFAKVTRPSCIVVMESGSAKENVVGTADFSDLTKPLKQAAISDPNYYENARQTVLSALPGKLFVTSGLNRYDIWKRVHGVPVDSLEALVDEDGIQRGVSPDLKEAFIVDSSTARKWKLEKENLKKVLTGGKQVRRYHIEYKDLLVVYTNRDDDFRNLPNICKFIEQYKEQITCKEVKEKKHPLYALHRARDPRIFEKRTKFIGVITGDEIILALDDHLTFATDGLYLFALKEDVVDKYLLGILNSKLFVFIYRLLAIEEGRVLAQVKPTMLGQLPIRTINFSDPADKSRHDKMVGLVGQMLDLHKKLAASRLDHEQTALQRQIDETDKQIDDLVYELYGLTEEEIKIVESR